MPSIIQQGHESGLLEPIPLTLMPEILSMQVVNDRQFRNMEYYFNSGIHGTYFTGVRHAQSLCKLLVGLDETTTIRVINELNQLCDIEYNAGSSRESPNKKHHPISIRMLELVREQGHTSSESLEFMLHELPIMVKEGLIGPSRFMGDISSLVSMYI